jgi:predicted AlkP superfamily pyrophosphatase or phosphodiesterase
MRWYLFMQLYVVQPIVRAAEEPAAVKHVVLVSIDGLAASYFDDPRAEMPALRKLAASGAMAKGMLTSFPSVTWPSHTSLITGVSPARHGVIGNSVWSRKLERSVVYIGDP